MTDKISISFSLNGAAVSVETPPIKRLAHVIREELGLSGTKIGCDAGDCGACTVLLDGRQVCACMVPAGQADGREVITVEGLAEDGEIAPLQAPQWPPSSNAARTVPWRRPGSP